MVSAAPPSGKQFSLELGDSPAVVTEVGAGLRSYCADGVELLDGYAVDQMCSGARGQSFLPWPNRIADGRYTFSGAEHQLPLTEPSATQRHPRADAVGRMASGQLERPQHHAAVPPASQPRLPVPPPLPDQLPAGVQRPRRRDPCDQRRDDGLPVRHRRTPLRLPRRRARRRPDRRAARRRLLPDRRPRDPHGAETGRRDDLRPARRQPARGPRAGHRLHRADPRRGRRVVGDRPLPRGQAAAAVDGRLLPLRRAVHR